MSITFQLPPDLEPKLCAETADIDSEARDAYALDLFRQGRLSHCELSNPLGLDRFQTDGYLQRHNVLEGSMTMGDLENQAENLDRVLGLIRC